MITRIEIDTEDVIDADGLVIYQLRIPRVAPPPETARTVGQAGPDERRHPVPPLITCWGTRRP
jgi:hypothetical protein